MNLFTGVPKLLYKAYRRPIDTKRQILLSTIMPKNKKKISDGKGKDAQDKGNIAKTSLCKPIYQGDKGDIIIKVHAKPGAKGSAVTDISNEAVGVQIGAPPVDGEANKELIRFLAEVLNMRKSDLNLEKGSRSKEKVITVSNISLDIVISKLSDASKQ